MVTADNINMKKGHMSYNKNTIRSKKLEHEQCSSNKRCSSAGRLSSSPAGAVTSLILMFILCGLIGLFNFGESAYAETLTLNIDNANLSLNLVPLSSTGTFSSSSNMNIAVSTDNVVGYTLSFTATNGDSLSNGSGSTISSIGTVSGVTAGGISENDYKNSSNTQYNNTWAYNPSQIATGSFSSTYSNTANSNYLPLPDTTGQILAITEKPNTNNTVDNYTISIGSRVTTDTPNGTYTSDAFTITAIANPMPIIMQELTASQCQTLAADSPLRVIDIRDNNTYTVRWINGDCWMTQNLRTTGVISAQYSNFSGADFNISQYSLDSSDSSYSGHCDYPNGYDNACSKDSGNTTTGVWYNFAAASAGTVTGSSNSTPATEDICPSGWHLPSGPNTTEGTDFNKLVGNTISGLQDITSSLTDFSATFGGYYNDGVIHSTGRGYWWSVNATSTTHRNNFLYASANNQFYGDSYGGRQTGIFVRCVMKRQYMQDLSYDDLEEMMPNVGDTATLYDKRDEEQYSVAKLCTKKTNNACEDYQFWMTKNLNFAPDATKTYTHADTDLGYTTGNVNETWTPLASAMTNAATISNFSYTTSANDSVSGWTNDNNLPHYAEGTTEGTKNGTEVIFYNNTKYTGMADCVSRSGLTEAECEHYKIGNYYNWSAAVASNDTSSITAQYTVADNSICPAGWRLPNGLTNNNGTIVQSEFNAMLSASGIANGIDLTTYANAGGTNVGYVPGTFGTLMSNNPLYFMQSGYINDSTLYRSMDSGNYWSSTVVSSGLAYNLGFSSGALRPAYRGDRYSGASVRCVARKPYMQEQTTASLNEMMPNEGDSVTLYDKRDEESYSVAKLCVNKTNNTCTDYQFWMTENLNFAPDATKTYTHKDTDLGYTTGNANETWQPQASTMGNSATITNFVWTDTANNSVSGWTNDDDQPHYAEGTTNGTANGTEVIFYNGTKYEGITDCAANSGLTEAECEHYKVGNYYNWSAAVASNNTSATSAQYTVMPNSICPAGWRLPNGLTNNNGAIVQSEFNALLFANSVANGVTTNAGTGWGGDNVGYVSGAFNTSMSNNPLYFVRSGYIDVSSLYHLSGDGRYWSSTVVSDKFAYYLIFNSGELYPAYRSGHYIGYSVRCLAR